MAHEPFIYEERRRIPIGANMAVRRSVFDRAGGFNPALGRKGKSLLGQEQAEFFYRTRAHGVRGMYVSADGTAPSRPARATHPLLFPPLVVLERHLTRPAAPNAPGNRARPRSSSSQAHQGRATICDRGSSRPRARACGAAVCAGIESAAWKKK